MWIGCGRQGEVVGGWQKNVGWVLGDEGGVGREREREDERMREKKRGRE